MRAVIANTFAEPAADRRDISFVKLRTGLSRNRMRGLKTPPIDILREAMTVVTL